MDINEGMQHGKLFPRIMHTNDTVSMDNNGEDDDDGEKDFILLQMPCVPKKFILKQEIKIEDIKVECLYPDDSVIIEGNEYEVDVADEYDADKAEDLVQVQEHQQELQEDASKKEHEKLKDELEQKIKDVKAYYSVISSMCNKLDGVIKSVDEKLACMEKLNVKYKKTIGKSLELTNSKCSGWTHVFGAPYFKDKQFFFAPKNFDVVQKEQKREINVNSLPNAHFWKPYEKQKMAQAIKKIEVKKRLGLSRRRIKDLSDELRDGVSEERRLEIEDELTDLRNRKKLIEQLSLAELVHGTTNEYDWLKISVTDLCNQHSPEECRSMWLAFLHPDINKAEWTTEEKEMLRDHAEEYRYQNWSLIADQLGTGRSAFQCIRFYQMNLNDQLIRKKWTEDEDQLVQQMVERYRVGTFIPWARVSANIEGRTKVQVFNRWKYCLEPSIRKGRFSEEEDVMILAAMRWYGKNFQQISRFIPGRTPVQLRDRYNVSLENTDEYEWDLSCDEKLVEMVEEFGQSAWAFISHSFPGFSRVQLRHRYFVIEKWRETHDEGFPPVRRYCLKRNYDSRLKDVLGPYIDITEEKAAILGDKPLFQIQNKLGLQHKKKRGRPKFRAKRKKYVTALDTLFLKHFSVSYHCHSSTSKRIADKEVIEEDGKLLKSLLTIFNAVLNIPGEEDIKKHFELRNHEDRRLVECLRDGSIAGKNIHVQQEAGNESVESQTEIAVTDVEVIPCNTFTVIVPKKCNYTLAAYVNKKRSISQNDGINSCTPQKHVTAEPVQGISKLSSGNQFKKSLASSSLSAMLPRKCSYSLAKSFMGNARMRNTDSSLVAHDPLRTFTEMQPIPCRSSSSVNADLNALCESPRIRTNQNNVHQSVSEVESNSCHRPISCDSSVPIDNGITIRWCLIPNYATLICCKTLLLCHAPLSRTIDRSMKRASIKKLREADTASTKLTLQNIVKSDDPFVLQEMLAEFDVDTDENCSSGTSSFTYAEADALCKQRFVSLLLFPALASIRHIKILDDVFDISNDKKQCRNQTGEETGSEKVYNTPLFRNKYKSRNFKHFLKSKLKENVPEVNTVSRNILSVPKAKPEPGKQKNRTGRKRKFENYQIEDRNTSFQTGAIPKRKYAERSPSRTRKSGRPRKPAPRDPEHLYH